MHIVVFYVLINSAFVGKNKFHNAGLQFTISFQYFFPWGIHELSKLNLG
jgi:hypothetical protein